jgi:hypothetical protein
MDMKVNSRFFSLPFFLVISSFVIILSCSQDEAKKHVGEKPKKEKVSVAEKTVSENKGFSSKKPQMEPSAVKDDGGAVSETVESPSEIVLISSLWKKHSKGPVKLTHREHFKIYGVSCKECHHIFKKGKNIWQAGMPVKKCETCHNDPTIKGEAGLPPGSRIRNLKLAFHKNCQMCHRKIKQQNSEAKAPTACGECHIKKGK